MWWFRAIRSGGLEVSLLWRWWKRPDPDGHCAVESGVDPPVVLVVEGLRSGKAQELDGSTSRIKSKGLLMDFYLTPQDIASPFCLGRVRKGSQSSCLVPFLGFAQSRLPK